jgi:diaminopimelate epimerase
VSRVVDVPFVKGHGTRNDFVILPDFDGLLDLSPERVRWLCDRRAGIGADGVLRVVRSACEPEFAQYADVAEFFMDYRNADGSVAEMCGNGARVFVRYLHASGSLSSRSTVIATRGGLIEAEVLGAESEEIAIGMGSVHSESSPPLPVSVELDGRSWDAQPVHVPNPHAVAFVDSLELVGDLTVPPHVTPAEVFPNGVNVEFVERLGPGHIRMRVHERGVGETMSCGTGACAAAWASTLLEPATDVFQVDVPGGTVWVDIAPDGQLTLRGPAELVARGTLQWPRGL